MVLLPLVGELNSTCLRISFNHSFLQVPSFLPQIEAHVNCQTGRRRISRHSNQPRSTKTSTRLGEKSGMNKTANTGDDGNNRELQMMFCRTSTKRCAKMCKTLALNLRGVGLFRCKGGREENNNSPHFLLVKYESAAGSLKCRLYMVSAPAWKS